MKATDCLAFPFKKMIFWMGFIIPLPIIILLQLLVYFPQVLGRHIELIDTKSFLFFLMIQAFMVLTSIYYAVMLCRKAPAIIIDSYGITYNTSIWGTIEVKWEAISRPILETSGKQKNLLLQVDHPEEFIHQATSLPMRLTMQVNQKLHKTPIVIQLYALSGDSSMLQNIIESELAQRKSAATRI